MKNQQFFQILYLSAIGLLISSTLVSQATSKSFPSSKKVLYHNHQLELRLAPEGNIISEHKKGTDNDEYYHVVQVTDHLTDSIKNQFLVVGCQIVDFINTNTLIVKASRRTIQKLIKKSLISYWSSYAPKYTLSSTLTEILENGITKLDAINMADSSQSKADLKERIVLLVQVFTGESLDTIIGQIKLINGKSERVIEQNNLQLLKVVISKKGIKSLSEIEGIKRIDLLSNYTTHSDVAAGIMNLSTVVNKLGLEGVGQVIGIADTGLDSGVNDNSMHQDFRGRIRALISKPVIGGQVPTDCGSTTLVSRINAGDNDGSADLYDGHGTHVASLALGSGTMSQGKYAGVAPKANLVFQALQQYTYHDNSNFDGFEMSGIPINLAELFDESYQFGARIHSNSWGSSCIRGEYTAQSEIIDQFVNDRDDMLILFSAGNTGVDLDEDNLIDPSSINPFAGAKNTLAVGATETERPAFPSTYLRYGTHRFGNSLAQQQMSDNSREVALFSARGPTQSNRIKPDVVAPGTFIVGARSQSSSNDTWFEDDFELESTLWSATGHWSRVANEARSGSFCWHDSPDQNYEDGSITSLTVRGLDLSNGNALRNKKLRFWYKSDFAEGDYWQIEIRDYVLDTRNILEFHWNSTNWEQMTIDLGPFSHTANLGITFRMKPENRDGLTAGGLSIDDVSVHEGAFLDGTLGEFGLTDKKSIEDENYVLSSGTSMATPLVAGVAALVREYYTRLNNRNYVSSSLLKATIINGAIDLSPEVGRYGIPDNEQGWGLVDLENTLSPPLPNLIDHIDELVGLKTGECHTYNFEIQSGQVPLSITLVYNDLPGANLINDLDLSLTAPDGTVYHPNGLLEPDRNNNVERIVIPNPIQGVYQVKINAFGVLADRQSYAIATRGHGTLDHRPPLALMLALDLSGSMLNSTCPDVGCDSKLERLKQAVELFTQLWSAVAVEGDKLGITYFRTNVEGYESAGSSLPGFDAEQIIEEIQSQVTDRSQMTAMGGGIQHAINVLKEDAPSHRKAIILFTDGLQNINPLIMQENGQGNSTSDHSMADGHIGRLKIDNKTGYMSSNIEPTEPVTILDESMNVTINTIGIGTLPHLLTKIAASTGGTCTISNTPEEDLRRFFVEQLINLLRGDSPQLVDFRTGETNSRKQKKSIQESFQINQSASKIIFSISLNRPGKFKVKVKKDGRIVDDFATKYSKGRFYQVITFQPNQDIESLEGYWEVQLEGLENWRYEIAAIADEAILDIQLKGTPSEISAGENLPIEVSVTLNGQKLKSNVTVNAEIICPSFKLGNLLSTFPISNEGLFGRRINGNIGEAKLSLLLQKSRFLKRLRHKIIPLKIKQQQDGRFREIFTKTKTQGVYEIDLVIKGSHPLIGKFERNERVMVNVLVDKPIIERSNPNIRFAGRLDKQNLYSIAIRPKDKFGNLLGPGFGEELTLRVGEEKKRFTFSENGLGRYETIAPLPIGKKSPLIFELSGKPILSGKAKTFKSPVYYFTIRSLVPFARTYPNDINSSCVILTGGIGRNLNRHFSVQILGGYNVLGHGEEFTGATTQINWNLGDGKVVPFLGAGPGYYKIGDHNYKFCFDLSTGLRFVLYSNNYITIGGNYVTPINLALDSRVLNVQIGAIFGF